MSNGMPLIRRLSRRGDDIWREPWYARSWATLIAMYAFFPLGVYLMWRYRPWPRWLKWLSTILGSVASVIGAIIGPLIARRIL